MSASNKKKLRKELESGKLTEKQLAAQKEARKLNLYTIGFLSVMALLLVVALVIGINQTIANSGSRERNTVAMTIGGQDISNAELSYYYIDYIQNFYNSYGSYVTYLGLDASKPLDEQYADKEAGLTWADSFLTSAKDNAVSVYALSAAAEEAGFAMPEEGTATVDNTLSNMELYGMLYGYEDTEAYLKAMYGKGASVESYRKYLEQNVLCSYYQQHYSDSLTYTDAEVQAADSQDYTAYDYSTYYLSVSRFLEGGTTAEDGTTTYSAEEEVASVIAAEEAAKSLAGAGTTTLEELDKAIAALKVNADTEASSSAYNGILRPNVSSIYADWITDASRKEGDVSYFANTSTAAAEDGTETTEVLGYYAVLYRGTEDNKFPLKNVRHILVSYEGGTTDSSTGVTTYSDEEKAAAKEAAEAILAQWKEGEATEDSFAALATEKTTDTGSAQTGGLYEDVYPGQMVTNFEDWCFDEARKTGDTGIVESDYGYHVMYFVGDSDVLYRNYLITTDLRTEAVNTWYADLLDAQTTTEGSVKYMNTSLVLSAN